jgi:hypothetical protein
MTRRVFKEFDVRGKWNLWTILFFIPFLIAYGVGKLWDNLKNGRNPRP